jgi:hypothetical protein
MPMADMDKETRLRIARKMAQLTALYFDLMDELERLIDIKGPPAEDGPEISDLMGPERDRWIERVNPRRKLEQVTDSATRYLAAVADEDEMAATHASWAGGGGSSNFETAMYRAHSFDNWTTEDDDDGDE